MGLFLFHLVAKLCLTVVPRTGVRQGLLSMGFPRQEYWSGLPFPPPGDLPKDGFISHYLRWLIVNNIVNSYGSKGLVGLGSPPWLVTGS